jgi:ComF family protein
MLSAALSILGREALRIVLPSWCAACDRELPWRDRTASCCASCWSALPRIAAPKCISCAVPSSVVASDPYLCVDCMIDPLPVEWSDAWGHYLGPLERLLHAFKFGRHDFLDAALASLLDEALQTRGDLAFDALVPVPMERGKERRRGYNQADLLARALATRTGITSDATLLTRRGEHDTQSTLTRRQRAANVKGAFTASTAAAGKSLLIIDDICTTGATLRACATALNRAGASRVCAIAVARA